MQTVFRILSLMTWIMQPGATLQTRPAEKARTMRNPLKMKIVLCLCLIMTFAGVVTAQTDLVLTDEIRTYENLENINVSMNGKSELHLTANRVPLSPGNGRDRLPRNASSLIRERRGIYDWLPNRRSTAMHGPVLQN
jgi:hypothetical protein